MKMNRRGFLAGTAAAAVAMGLPKPPAARAGIKADSWASIIDLTLCDGCQDKEEPLCVSSCRAGNGHRFPEPAEDQLRDYWPQKSHEDWSSRRQVNDQLTPYNWIFVQQVEVAGEKVSIPRRCMHCDNPPCVKLCPFGVNHKSPEGPVYIDPKLCFGGAKCRTVCPWQVPQRQAGVGIYTNWQKLLPVGGGVMFKCDLCRKRLAEEKTPFCMEKCPKKAMRVGQRQEMLAEAQRLRDSYNGFLYGVDENGGTSTFYVSKVDFKELNQALADQASEEKGLMPLHEPENMLAKQKGLAALSLAAPLAGGLAAFVMAGKGKEVNK